MLEIPTMCLDKAIEGQHVILLWRGWGGAGRDGRGWGGLFGGNAGFVCGLVQIKK